MSVRLMTQVWDSGCYSGGTLLVLLAMADFANDNGKRIFPHIETLAGKARLSVRAVQMAINDLIEDGVLSTQDRRGGKGKLVEFQMDVERVQTMRPMEEQDVKDELGASKARNRRPKRVQPDAAKGATPSAHIDNHQENHQEEPSSETPAPVCVAEVVSETDLAINAYLEAAAKTHEKMGWVIPRGVIPEKVRRAIKARLKDEGLDGWCRAMASGAESDFLAGRTGRGNGHAGWRVNIEWISLPGNFAKVRDNAYPNTKRMGSLSPILEGVGSAVQELQRRGH